MSKRLGGNAGCCCAIVKEGALVSPKGSHWAGLFYVRLCYCKRRSASESEGIPLGGAREVQKYSLSVWPFKARSLII